MSVLRTVLTRETWGHQLRRARELSGVALRDAAKAISEFEPTSHQRLLNLEMLESPPSDSGRRLLAVLAAVAYGFEPEALDLSWDDMPRRLERDEVIRQLITSGPGSAWVPVTAGQEHLRAA